MGSKHQKLDERVAVLPVLIEKKKRKPRCRIYLVTSRCQGTWIIPTGKLEKKLSNRRVAELEAFEEAGVIGKIDERFKLQVWMYSPCGKKKRKTTIYLLHVKRTLRCWPEHKQRKRKSISLEDYMRTVPDKKLKRRLKAVI